jgi:hypothetical protein
MCILIFVVLVNWSPIKGWQLVGGLNKEIHWLFFIFIGGGGIRSFDEKAGGVSVF